MELTERLIAIQRQIREDFGGRLRYVGRYLEQQKVVQPSLLYPALLLDLDDIYFERKNSTDYQMSGYLMVRLMTEQGMGNAIDGNFEGVRLLDDVVAWFAMNRTNGDFVEYYKPHSLTRYHENWGYATNSRGGGNLALRGVDIWELKVAVSWKSRFAFSGQGTTSAIGSGVIGSSFVVGGVGLNGVFASVNDASNRAYESLVAEGLKVDLLSVDEENGSFTIKARIDN